ncbi:MAG: capsular polysaccharide biosynthesis protein [Nitrospira sp. CG24E]|nr:MAG: capsular polysaccharide biosynthesis protein [Nitrospira sp. CG24E]
MVNRYGVFNRGLRKLSTLGEFLGEPVEPVYFFTPTGLTGTLGWGRRKYARRARRVATSRGIPFLCLEDGFLRSVGLGKTEPPLSIVVDDLGIYYDATHPSRLESQIARPLTGEQTSRARAMITAWRNGRVSKYNYAQDYAGDLPERYVLVVDQTWGDASISFGMADESSFQRMLDRAIEENQACTVLLKVHPEVLTGRKRGHFNLESTARRSNVQVIGDDVHPVNLIEHAEALYVVTSQMGFEGLLWGKPVRTFGMPFYAGWGLTRDELPAPERRRPVPLENLIHAALIEYLRYVDPETGRRCEAERVVEWMGLQRRMRTRFPNDVYALSFSPWKKPIVRRFFQGNRVHFVDAVDQVPEDATLAVWGQGHQDEKRPIVRLEDAFLRSVGLGADLIQPLSWVMDSRGMYYDATAPSELEHALLTTEFPADLLMRAKRLRDRIVEGGLTKYNVGVGTWRRPQEALRVILVPGQVESDASIRYGGSSIRSNMQLLQAVREANPSAYVIYKPHPDVVAGLRTKGAGEDEALRWCDEVVTDVAMGTLLSAVDEVHVLTSLAGFEALLRGKKVTCYGQPFYAGWGLTDDRTPPARRTRRLTLDELVAGALILYPTYVSRTTGKFTTAERALDELLDWRQQKPTGMPLWRKALRLVLRLGKKSD